MTYLSPGPGDPETWGGPTGHPHDPRTDDAPECPGCGEQEWVDEEGCAECGWSSTGPDYEQMMEDRR